MNMKSIIGACIGCATAGGWLLVDLLLPDPIGDYLLYILMAVFNGVVGWQVSRLFRKPRKMAVTNKQIGNERTEGSFEFES